MIARFNSCSSVSGKTHLLDLVDTLVVNYDDTFHQQLAEEGFFQALISYQKVLHLSLVHFKTSYWLYVGSNRPAVLHRCTGTPDNLARESIRKGI